MAARKRIKAREQNRKESMAEPPKNHSKAMSAGDVKYKINRLYRYHRMLGNKGGFATGDALRPFPLLFGILIHPFRIKRSAFLWVKFQSARWVTIQSAPTDVGNSLNAEAVTASRVLVMESDAPADPQKVVLIVCSK